MLDACELGDGNIHSPCEEQEDEPDIGVDEDLVAVVHGVVHGDGFGDDVGRCSSDIQLVDNDTHTWRSGGSLVGLAMKVDLCLL